MNALKHATAIMVIPENWFIMRSDVVSKDAEAVMGWCDLCGTIPPIPCANGYMRRECEHSRYARYSARNGQGAPPASPRCYTWLGKEAGDLPEKSFENFDPNAQEDSAAFTGYLATCKLYAGQIVLKQPVDNLLMVGGYGTGKTHLAAAILNHVRHSGIGCLFCTAQDLFDAFYAADFDEQQKLINQASTTPLLVFDDLDKLYIPKDGTFQKKRLLSIIGNRYLSHRPVIITTNEQRDLSQWLDGAAMSRLGQHLTPLVMNGVDYRGRRNT